jgi:hypothetical protein
LSCTFGRGWTNHRTSRQRFVKERGWLGHDQVRLKIFSIQRRRI